MKEGTVIITGFHAHVYYNSSNRDAAARVREGLGSRFNVQLGRWHHDKLDNFLMHGCNTSGSNWEGDKERGVKGEKLDQE